LGLIGDRDFPVAGAKELELIVAKGRTHLWVERPLSNSIEKGVNE
jgi:hypothetical protein